MTPLFSKATLTTIGSILVTAAVYLAPPWSVLAATIGGLLGGAALIKRPGDVKAES